MKDLKRRQILPERLSFEPKFSQDHKSLLIFPVGGQIREKLIFILAPPQFLHKMLKELNPSEKASCLYWTFLSITNRFYFSRRWSNEKEMHFYSGAFTIFMKNLKRHQILPETLSFEPKFSQDHKSLLIFPVGGQIGEKRICILALPPFLDKM